MAPLDRRPFNMTLSRQAWIRALVLLLVCCFWAGSAAGSEEGEWQQFERRARDGAVTVKEGRKEIARWAGILERAYPPEQFSRNVRFPLRGYSLDAVGGKNGEGFRPSGYEFLGGNRHRGHPAQDLFVHDRNQDGVDDRTGRPFEVLAIADGVVVSVFAEWDQAGGGSTVRGGNYIWLYHPGLGLFSYYAHLRKAAVAVGDPVAGGARIATLGRTGTNAFPIRSPTHLHLMLLRARDMTPVDPYPLLRQGR